MEQLDCVLKFKEINIVQLRIIISRMKNKKDVNGINKAFILDCFGAIGQSLVDIINESLMVGYVARNWKESVIIPVLKVINSIKRQDFRPVNMLLTCEKILETVVKEQLIQYIETNKFVIDEQSGYRENHSCETALIFLIADWKVENMIVCVCDLKRAFETIDSDRLLQKLMNYGIKDNELKWFEMYLSERFQKTKFGQILDASVK